MGVETLTKYSDPRDLLYKDGNFVVFYPPRFLVRVSPAHFVGWVQSQGISMDDSDRDKILEYAVLGPDNPHEELVRSYYQKALGRRASRGGRQVDELLLDLEVSYNLYKDTIIEHTDLPLGGWEIWAAAHTDKLAEGAGLTPKEAGWYDLKAFDALVVLTGRALSGGIQVKDLNPVEILKTTLQNTANLHELYRERYAGHLRELGEEQDGLVRLKAGMARLAQALESKVARKKFTTLAQHMYADLHDDPPLVGLPPEPPGISLKSLEAASPHVFSAAELKSLLHFFDTTPGPEIVRGYRVILHAMARIFSSLSEPDQLALGVQLANRRVGLVAFQKNFFAQAVSRLRGFGQADNTRSLVLQGLSVAAQGGRSGVGGKAWAIFRLAGFLGEMDAAWTNQLHPKEPVETLWGLAPTYHQRARQPGLELVDQLLQSDLRAALLIPTSALGLPNDYYAKTSDDQNRGSELTELYPGCRIIGLGVVALPDGYKLEVPDGSGEMKIYDESGEVVAVRPKDSLRGINVLERKEELFDWALQAVVRHKKSPYNLQILHFDGLNDVSSLEMVSRLSQKIADLGVTARPLYGLMGKAYRVEREGNFLFDLAFSPSTGLVAIYREAGEVIAEAATEDLLHGLLSHTP